MRTEGRHLIRVSGIRKRLRRLLISLPNKGSFRRVTQDCFGINEKEKSGKHGKFDSLWTGPYIIHDVAGSNSFYLNQLDGEKLTLQVNE
jgi:hypothetical protein